ncbi:putative hem oxygenase HugZ-like superfamily [Helianthus anomalus]
MVRFSSFVFRFVNLFLHIVVVMCFGELIPRSDFEGKEEDLDVINGHRYEPGPSQDGPNLEEELQKDQVSGNETSYYKLEFVKIHLISAHGNQRAKPDAIAHSAPKIISRLKSGGEKTTLALKSLCWRWKGLQVEVTSAHFMFLCLPTLCRRFLMMIICVYNQVLTYIRCEEVAVIGVDSLGFDVRVCSGRQVQTLRFAFKKRVNMLPKQSHD